MTKSEKKSHCITKPICFVHVGHLNMQEKDVRQNENLPLEGVVGAITKSEKKVIV